MSSHGTGVFVADGLGKFIVGAPWAPGTIVQLQGETVDALDLPYATLEYLQENAPPPAPPQPGAIVVTWGFCALTFENSGGFAKRISAASLVGSRYTMFTRFRIAAFAPQVYSFSRLPIYEVIFTEYTFYKGPVESWPAFETADIWAQMAWSGPDDTGETQYLAVGWRLLINPPSGELGSFPGIVGGISLFFNWGPQAEPPAIVTPIPFDDFQFDTWYTAKMDVDQDFGEASLYIWPEGEAEPTIPIATSSFAPVLSESPEYCQVGGAGDISVSSGFEADWDYFRLIDGAGIYVRGAGQRR